MKKLPNQSKLEMFKIQLASFINQEQELCLLAKQIDWSSVDESSPKYRSDNK